MAIQTSVYNLGSQSNIFYTHNLQGHDPANNASRHITMTVHANGSATFSITDQAIGRWETITMAEYRQLLLEALPAENLIFVVEQQPHNLDDKETADARSFLENL